MSVKALFNQTRDFIDIRMNDQLAPFTGDVNWDLNERNISPTSRDAVKYLPQCVEQAGKGEVGLLNSIVEFQSQLAWFISYPEDAFGGNVVNGLAAAELIGPNGNFMSDEFRLGFILIAPNIEYPEHWHVSDELYIPMTNGSYWSADGDEFVERKSGEIIVHESNERHATTTKDAPLFALWIWRGGDLGQRPDY